MKVGGFILAAAIVLTGCSSATHDAQTSTPAASQSQTSAAAANLSGAASCTDVTGDAKSLDLKSIRLAGDGDSLGVSWTLTEPVGDQSAVLYVDAVGNHHYQFSITFSKGAQSRQEITDMASGQKEDIPLAIDNIGAIEIAHFPAPAALGKSFKWFGGSSVGKATVDTCPSKSRRMPFPQS